MRTLCAIVGVLVATSASVTQKDLRMWMTVGERRFAITLADSAAARAFAAQLPLTLGMSELNGNEKHAELPKALPTNANRPGTIRSGDLMLYGSTTLVVFYETFESSYSYTPLGRIRRRLDGAIFGLCFRRNSIGSTEAPETRNPSNRGH